MNRRNLLLLCMLWAAVILIVMSLAGLDRTWLAGIVYLPAIIIAVALSRQHGHVPDAAGVWIGAISWSLLYWTLVLLLYALLLEAWLLRSATARLTDGLRQTELADKDNLEGHLACFGAILGQLERRRRSHWLLAAIPGVDLDAGPAQLARDALQRSPRHRAVSGVLRALGSALRDRHGLTDGNAAVRRLQDEVGITPQGAVGVPDRDGL